MPLMECQSNNKNGWKWGHSGHCFTGKSGKAMAIEQSKAIRANMYADKEIAGCYDTVDFEDVILEIGQHE